MTAKRDELQMHLERVVPSPRPLVFALHTEPDKLARWWGPKGFSVPSIALDLRTGGRYRIEMQPPNGDRFFLTGEFCDIEPPDQLSYTFRWEEPDPDDRDTVVVFSLEDYGDSTLVIVEQGPFLTEAGVGTYTRTVGPKLSTAYPITNPKQGELVMTITVDYDYARALDGSLHHSWSVDEVFRGRTFDFTTRFLPERIAGVDSIACLDDDERRKLNQIRGNSYCHLFAFVEEYIVPMVLANATRDVYGDETRLWSLLRFAEEEVKHQEMMRRACDQFAVGFGTSCELVTGREAVAQAVLSTSPLAALLLTSAIEWFVQLHYVEHVRDDQRLDPLFRDLLKYHWIDESRHAKLDSLLIAEVASEASEAELEGSIDEVLRLGMAVDGLLAQQVELDIDALGRACSRVFSADERDEIRTAQRRAYRWTFLVSGLEHPRFLEVVDAVTREGRAKLDAAAEALSA